MKELHAFSKALWITSSTALQKQDSKIQLAEELLL